MKLYKKIVVLTIIFLLLSINAQSYYNINQNKQKNNSKYLLNDAYLIEKDDVKILYLNGTYYEMGYQHGYLLKEEVNQNMRAFLEFGEELTTYENLINIWNKTEPYIPNCYIEEMQGLADGAEIPFERAAALYMVILYLDMKCFTFAAWSNATKDKNLYHIRSLDFPLKIKDPKTNRYIQENSLLIIRNPKNGLKSISPSIAGSINFYQGINEKQISIGVQVCWSYDQTLKGLPANYKVLQILDNATNAEEAIQILIENKTLGWNFIISDGIKGIAYAVEITANHSYVGTWNNPVEEEGDYWQIKEVVRRTNFFIEPTMASTQRKNYKTGGIRNFLALFKGEPFFSLWRKYKSMSIEIEKNWGKIDLNSSIGLLRKVYSGKTDIFMLIFILLAKNSILCDFHQWSFCPKTGEFVISFAEANKYAHEAKLHYFNIYDLLEG